MAKYAMVVTYEVDVTIKVKVCGDMLVDAESPEELKKILTHQLYNLNHIPKGAKFSNRVIGNKEEILEAIERKIKDSPLTGPCDVENLSLEEESYERTMVKNCPYEIK